MLSACKRLKLNVLNWKSNRGTPTFWRRLLRFMGQHKDRSFQGAACPDGRSDKTSCLSNLSPPFAIRMSSPVAWSAPKKMNRAKSCDSTHVPYLRCHVLKAFQICQLLRRTSLFHILFFTSAVEKILKTKYKSMKLQTWQFLFHP